MGRVPGRIEIDAPNGSVLAGSLSMALHDSTAAGALRLLEIESRRWQSVLDTAQDAIISIDPHGRITLFNRAAEEIFGYRADEVLQQNVTLLMPSPYREQHDQFLRNYQATGEAKAIGRIRHVEARRKSGETFPIELSVSEARVGDTVLYSAIIRDVSERARMEAALRERMRQQEAVAELGLAALGSDLDMLLEKAVELVARTLDVEYCELLELLPDGTTLLLRAGVGWTDGQVGHATVPAGTGRRRATRCSRERPSCSTISGPKRDSRHLPFSASTGSYPVSAS